MDTTTRAFVPRSRAVERSPMRFSKALAGDPIGGKETNEEIDQARTANYHAVPTLAQEILGIALKTRHQPA